MTRLYQYNLKFKLQIIIDTPRSAYIQHLQFSIISGIDQNTFTKKYLSVISELIENNSKYLNHHAFTLLIKRNLLNLGITLNTSNTNNQYPIYEQQTMLFLTIPTMLPKKD